MSPREEVLSLVDTSVRKGPNGNQGRGGSQTLDLRGAYAFMQRPYGRQGRPGLGFVSPAQGSSSLSLIWFN